MTPPNLEEMKKHEDFDEDVELLELESEEGLVVSESALRQLSKIASREPPDSALALRLAVESGGCHGYQYKMELDDDGAGVGDYIFQPEGEKCIPIVIDLISLDLMKGSTLHFSTELIGSSFSILDNPQAKQGGNCGCGVSWEAK